MEKIGAQTIWSYFDETSDAKSATNSAIRAGSGHPVSSYFRLAKKVAELQFRNRDYVLLFRGQAADHRTSKGNSTLKPTIFRLDGLKIPRKAALTLRFHTLRSAEAQLASRYAAEGFLGTERLKRQRILRWSILQHYEVCRTPLLDVTQSLRVAASFASLGNESEDAYLFVFGVPNLSGAITASAEAGLQIVRLSSACPPEAVRPHLQEGYLLGEYPEIADYDQKAHYEYYETDFGRRLVAKFKFNPTTFWKSENYPQATGDALYPRQHRDRLLTITETIKSSIASSDT